MGDPADDKPRHAPVKDAGVPTLIGSTISDRYRIERLLGEGGMGAVYQAEHTLMRKRMAIKVLHPEMIRLPEVVARFEREAMAAAHIDHPHVVTATDFGKLEDGSFFLALEFVEGKSLREVIAAGRLELGQALHIARQMASALSRAHSLKIVHRDLKPENVMLVVRDADPNFVKVLDFGIAKVQIGELGTNDRAGPEQNLLTQAGMVYGTPEYMAPEQALGQPVDARADLYALGVIMYEMLTGHRPFEADSKVALLGMQVTAPVPPMVMKCADCNVPPEVEALVRRLLAKEADDRIADAKEVIDNLSVFLTQLSTAGRIDPSYAPPAPSGLQTHPSLSGVMPARIDVTTSGEALGQKAGKQQGWLIATGAGVVGLIALVIAVVVAVRHRDLASEFNDAAGLAADSDSGSPSPTPTTAEGEQIGDAIGMIRRGDYGSGIKQLNDLGDLIQNRPDAHRALLEAYIGTDRPKEAMKEAGLVIQTQPNIVLLEETKLRVNIRDTALLEGSTDSTQQSAASDAFTLLKTQMDTVGWDDLYDIGYGQSGTQYPKAAARARSELAKGPRSKMSPGLQVTLDLHSAGTTCNAKNHFERAQRDGDVRALALLKQLANAHAMKQSGFRKIDLLACLHDGQLTRTIAALDERLKQRK